MLNAGAAGIAPLALTSLARSEGRTRPRQSRHTPPTLLFAARDLQTFRHRTRTNEIAAGAYRTMLAQAEKYLDLTVDPYVFQGALAGRALTMQVLDLAFAGYLSRNSRYTNKAVAILRAAAQQSTVDDFVGFNDALAVGDVLHGYAVGYDWLYPFLTSDERASILDQIHDCGDWLYTHSQTDPWGLANDSREAWNWNGVTHGSLGLAALVLGDQPSWLDRATERCSEYLNQARDRTGDPYEGLSYGSYGLMDVIPFCAALERHTGRDLLARSWPSRRAADYVRWNVYPWGSKTVAINQSSPSISPPAFLYYLVNKFRDREGLWAWRKMVGPEGDGTYGETAYYGGTSLPYDIIWTDPSLRPKQPSSGHGRPSKVFRRGQVCARDSWADDASLVTFTPCTSLPSIHNHEDANNVTFTTRGEEFVIDQGAGYYDSAQHNVVLIDGVGMQYWLNGPDAQLTGYRDHGTHVYARGDATAAYLPVQQVDHVERQILFGRASQPYLVIVDDVCKDSAQHLFTTRLYTRSGNTIAVEDVERRGMITGQNTGSTLDVHAFGTGAVALTEVPANSADNATPSPALELSTLAVNPEFVTLLVARKPGETVPDIRTRGHGLGMTITLAFPDGVVDTIRVRRNGIALRRRHADSRPFGGHSGLEAR